MDKQTRHLDAQLKSHFAKYRQVLVLLGPRQVGKTTVLQRLFPDAQYFLLDNKPIRDLFERYDINVYRQFIKSTSKIVVLDEIHLLSDPGLAAKIIYDQLPDIQLIITGSSALNIKNKTSESLAGRKIDYKFYPLTFSEFLFQNSITDAFDYHLIERIIHPDTLTKENIYPFDLGATLENVLIYGLYPNILNVPADSRYLENLADSVIFKDILELNLIENKSNALQLLKLLAYQIGNLISYADIANRIGIDMRTVKRYIDIFEQSFIIYRLYPFSQNSRDEIGKSPKIYFYDTGLRNALINNFSQIQIRNDRGALFENFIITEIIKLNSYGNYGYKLYYWRLRQGAEVDIVLKKEGTFIGIEVKYVGGKISRAFMNRYPQVKTGVVTAKNFY